jgi:hypothetical protein
MVIKSPVGREGHVRIYVVEVPLHMLRQPPQLVTHVKCQPIRCLLILPQQSSSTTSKPSEHTRIPYQKPNYEQPACQMKTARHCLNFGRKNEKKEKTFLFFTQRPPQKCKGKRSGDT